MMNKVTLIGNIGKDPETKQIPSGAVSSFSLATSDRWKDKQTGEKKEKTEWHNVVCYGGLSSVVSNYLHKGSKVCVEGAIRSRSYETKEGEKRYVTEIIASDILMLDGKPTGSDNTDQGAPGY